MNNLLASLEIIIPNGLKVLERRYKILKGIEHYQPVGRRKLSNKLNITERILRNDTDFLKMNRLIKVFPTGMTVTNEGLQLTKDLEIIMHDLKRLSYFEEKIQYILKDIKVIVVSGNSDQDDFVKSNIGKVASKVLINYLDESSIIAITGGSTVAQMVSQFNKEIKSYKKALVVPARGGLGNKVEYQANTLASKLASKIGAPYKLLNVPDNLGRKALESVQKEPEIKNTISYLLRANILIFGIGDALKMAKRRNLSDTLIDFLKRKKAVAEAFGYYFNQQGQIVYSSKTIGVKVDQLKTLPISIALAGGNSKAKAILALKKYLKNGCLIIDEGAAAEIIKQYELQNSL